MEKYIIKVYGKTIKKSTNKNTIMKRRNFLKQTAAVATTTLIGFPEIIRAQSSQQENPTFLLFESPYGESDFSYSIGLNVYPSSNFIKESKDGIIEFKINDFSGKSMKRKEGKFMIHKVKKKGDNEFEVTSKFQNYISGSSNFSKQYATKFSFKIYLNDNDPKNSYINLKSKSEKKNIKLLPQKPATGCFITTACLESKKVTTDCYEQNTLKEFFTHQYKIIEKEEKQLMQLYYQKAPALVNRINNCENSEEIYDYIYTHLLIKTVDLIDSNKSTEAFNHYKNFSIALNSKID